MLVTAADMDELEHLETHGISRYLLKPIQYSLFYDAIHEELAARTTVQPSEVFADAESPAHNRRILVVEDNDFNQQVAQEFLEGEGAIVQIAENGLKALQALEKQAYDLVFMDMQMPVMDGLTATRAIRAMARFDQMPIVAMTANALPEEKQQCLDAGMNDFLTKPLVPEQLYAVLRVWLGHLS